MIKSALTIFLLIFLTSLAIKVNSDQSYEWLNDNAQSSAVIAGILAPFVYLFIFIKKHKVVVRIALVIILALPLICAFTLLVTDTRMLILMATQPSDPSTFLDAPRVAKFLLMKVPAVHSPENSAFQGDLRATDIPLVIYSQRGIGEYSDPKAKERAYEILRWLIEKGEPLNERSPNGFTAIHESIIAKDPIYLEMLVSAGADPRQKVDSVRTKVHGLDSMELLDRLDDHGTKGEYSELRMILERAYIDQGIECSKCLTESNH